MARGFVGDIKWCDKGALAVCLFQNLRTLVQNDQLRGFPNRSPFHFQRYLSPLARLCSNCQAIDHMVMNCPKQKVQEKDVIRWCKDCAQLHPIEHNTYGLLKCENFVQDETPCRICVGLHSDPVASLKHRARDCPHLKPRYDSKFISEFVQRNRSDMRHSNAAPAVSLSSVPSNAVNAHTGAQPLAAAPKTYASAASSSSHRYLETFANAHRQPQPPVRVPAPAVSPLPAAPAPFAQFQVLVDMVSSFENERRLMNDKVENEKRETNEKINVLTQQCQEMKASLEGIHKLLDRVASAVASKFDFAPFLRASASEPQLPAPNAASSSSISQPKAAESPAPAAPAAAPQRPPLKEIPTQNTYAVLSGDEREQTADDENENAHTPEDDPPWEQGRGKRSKSTRKPLDKRIVMNGGLYILSPEKPKPTSKRAKGSTPDLSQQSSHSQDEATADVSTSQHRHKKPYRPRSPSHSPNVPPK